MAEVTHKAPNVPLGKFKRTKIIATTGPSVNSYEAILALIEAGANGLRLNFSHGTYDERKQQIAWIRQASVQCSKPVAIIQDLQGPKIRLGDFEGIISVKEGQELILEYGADYETSGRLPIQYDLSKKVKRGEAIYLYDGRVRGTISSVRGAAIYVRVSNAGTLMKRKGINLPDTDFGGDIITAKDKKDIAFGSSNDVDYVALSFVQTAQDIRILRRLLRNLNSSAKIIAKIETKPAIENLEEIITESDAVMIARGDLAIETLPESVPIVQRQIIGLGMKHAKPTIVATQMLSTMSDSPEPTRAEVSDVATAVLVGADCVMLSDETASGSYPIESVATMKRVINYTEENAPLKTVFAHQMEERMHPKSRQSSISAAVITLADDIDAQAIVAETKSGATALQISSRRPIQPIIAVTSEARTANQLAIVFGTKSFVRPDDKLAAQKLTDWLRQTKLFHKGDTIVSCVGQYPGVVGTTDTIKVRVLE